MRIPSLYAKELNLRNDTKVNGVVLSDQVKRLNWKVRKAEFVEKSGSDILAQVKSKLMLLME